MYEDYFGLERSPFKITPDTSLFYEGGKRGDILVALAYAIHRGEGIIKVVGEVGSGKTMLCRMLQLQLPDTVEIVYIANPSVSADDILFVIAHELSLPVDKGASKHEVMHMLQDYLLQRHMENKQVVLFVEEAQGMPLETLEEIRLLSNLETDENKLLQIILFGQPELDQNLAQQSIRQLRERITHTFNLEPLTQEEIHTYLNFRMREVGYTGPELVNTAVAKKIELHSEGLLRRINIIADKILLSAFAEGTHNLSAKHVTAAVNDSTFGQVAPRQTRWFWWLIVPLLLVALAFAGYQTRTQWLPWAMTTMQTMLLADTEPAPVVDADATPSFDPSESVVASVENSVAGELSSESASASLPDQAVNTAPVPQQATVEPEQQEVEMVVVESTGVTDQPSATANQPTTVPADMESLSADINVLVSEVEVAVQQASVKAEVNPEVEPRQAASNAPKASVEVAQNAAVAAVEPAGTDSNSLTGDYRQWLNVKLEQSKYWLSNAARDNMSIQVMMRGKSAAPELVYYLRNEWPLELTDTYMYEYTVDGRSIYRIFYGEFQSLSAAKSQIERFPESVRVNLPYVHSIYRMRKAFL